VDLPEDGSNSTFDGRDGKVDESDGFSAGNTLECAPSAASEAPSPPPKHTNNTPHGNGDPPPAFATTSTETIDFSIGLGFAAHIYVSL
jgi:hypothetical protein